MKECELIVLYHIHIYATHMYIYKYTNKYMYDLIRGQYVIFLYAFKCIIYENHLLLYAQLFSIYHLVS